MDAADWDRRYESHEHFWGRKANRFLEEEVSGLSPGRALDLAAGEGRNAVWLAERGWRVRAVDFSPVALERAGRVAATRGVEVELVEADLREYVPEPRAFDLVLVLYLHRPWPEVESVLRRAAAAVAPGGTLLVVGHDLSNLESGYGGPQAAEVLYRPGDVADAVAELEIERAEVVERPVETEGGTQIALDNLVRATRPA